MAHVADIKLALANYFFFLGGGGGVFLRTKVIWLKVIWLKVIWQRLFGISENKGYLAKQQLKTFTSFHYHIVLCFFFAEILHMFPSYGILHYLNSITK